MNTGIIDGYTVRGYICKDSIVPTPTEVYRYYSQIYMSVYRVVSMGVCNPTRSRDW